MIGTEDYKNINEANSAFDNRQGSIRDYKLPGSSYGGQLLDNGFAEEIRGLRRYIVDLAKELARIKFKRCENEKEMKIGREISLAHTKLQEAYLWLGEALFRLKKEVENASRI